MYLEINNPKKIRSVQKEEEEKIKEEKEKTQRKRKQDKNLPGAQL